MSLSKSLLNILFLLIPQDGVKETQGSLVFLFFLFFFWFLLTLWPQHSLSPVFWSLQVKELLYLEGTREHLILIQSLYPASSTRGCPPDDHLSISRELEGGGEGVCLSGKGSKVFKQGGVGLLHLPSLLHLPYSEKVNRKLPPPVGTAKSITFTLQGILAGDVFRRHGTESSCLLQYLSCINRPTALLKKKKVYPLPPHVVNHQTVLISSQKESSLLNLIFPFHFHCLIVFHRGSTLFSLPSRAVYP